jgi:hypothetical protein
MGRCFIFMLSLLFCKIPDNEQGEQHTGKVHENALNLHALFRKFLQTELAEA